MIKRKLKIVEDIILSKDPGIIKPKFFLSSSKRDTYLKIDDNQYLFLKTLIPYLNGNYDIYHIEKKISNYYNKNIKIESLVNFLDKYNLLEDSNNKQIKKVEFELSGKKIIELPLEKIQKNNEKIFNLIFKFFMLVSFIFISYFLFSIIFNWNDFKEAYMVSKNITWSNVTISEYIILFIGVIFSVLFHEIGHMLCANYFNVKIKSLNILLVMGINPVFYIRYKDLLLTTSKNKIKILICGTYFNIILAFIYWILLCILPDWKLAILMIFNLVCIINNLSLLGTTDGYYIASTFFNIEGLRWDMLKRVGRIFDKKKKSSLDIENLLIILYFIVSYTITFYGIYYLLRLIIDFLNFNFITSKILILLVIIAFFVSVLISIIKFVKSLKNINRKN